jgi:hypothetical protein
MGVEAAVMEKSGLGTMRVMTDVSAERYWTIVAECYHDLVDHGRREIYRIEG